MPFSSLSFALNSSLPTSQHYPIDQEQPMAANTKSTAYLFTSSILYLLFSIHSLCPLFLAVKVKEKLFFRTIHLLISLLQSFTVAAEGDRR
jgi:hypothetical protein